MSNLNILFTAMDSYGHVNCCLGLAETLKNRGHKITFTLKKAWEGLVQKHDFDFIELICPPEEPENAEKKVIKEEEKNQKVIKEEDKNQKVIKEDEKNQKVIHEDEKVVREEKDDNKKEKVISVNQTNGGDEESKKTIIKDDDEETSGPNKFLVDFVRKNLDSYRRTPMENVSMPDSPENQDFISFYKVMQQMNEPLGKVIEQLKPDIVIIDFMCRLPCLIKSTVPWVQIWSPNPIIIFGEKLPPLGTGFPTDSSKEMWQEYKKLSKIRWHNSNVMNREWLKSYGIDVDEDDDNFILFESPYLNLYSYPEALDYTDIADRPKLWFRMDSSVREPDEKKAFDVPEKLANKPGKLIYFSLGSMGSVDLELMRNVIRVLSKSPYRVIVSKGPLHKQLELPDNMWGDGFVNQLAILPHVDLVITHGGNNTLTESLYFGKPMIVMPIFFDQLDNAQRVHEKKFGIRIDTYRFKDEELLEALEKLLNDKELHARIEKVSQDLKNSKTQSKACELIEKLAKSKKCPLEDDCK